MSAAEPLELPELDAASLGVINGLVGVHRPLKLNLSGTPATLRFVAATARAGSLTPVPTAAFTLNSQPLWLATLDWNALPPVAKLLQGEALERLPAQVAAAVLSAALETYLDQLTAISGGNATLDQVGTLDASAALVAVGLELTPQGGAPVRGTLYGDLRALEVVRDLAAQAPLEPVHSFRDAMLFAGVEIGMTQLGIADLRALSPGDVVLLDVATSQDQPVGLLRFAPQSGWRAKIEPGQVTLVESVTLAHWGRDPAGVVVPLVFEQGRVGLPVAEIAALQAGATLPVTDHEQITIRSGEHLVGRGELVLLGSRTGARLTEWGIGVS